MGIDVIITRSIIYMATSLFGVLLIFSMFRCLTIKLSKYFPIKLNDELLALKASATQKKNSRIALLDTVLVDFWKKHKGYFIFFAFIIFWTSVGIAIDCKSDCSYTCYPDVMTMGQKLSVVKSELNYFVSNSSFFFFFFLILKIIGIRNFNGRNTIGLGLTETFVMIFFYSVLCLSCGCYCNSNTLTLILFSLSLYLFLVIMALTMVLWIFIKSIRYLKPISYRLGIQDPLDFIILIFATFPFIWIVYIIISII